MFQVEHFEEFGGRDVTQVDGHMVGHFSGHRMIIRRLVGVDKYDNPSQIAEVFHAEHLSIGRNYCMMFTTFMHH